MVFRRRNFRRKFKKRFPRKRSAMSSILKRKRAFSRIRKSKISRGIRQANYVSRASTMRSFTRLIPDSVLKAPNGVPVGSGVADAGFIGTGDHTLLAYQQVLETLQIGALHRDGSEPGNCSIFSEELLNELQLWSEAKTISVKYTLIPVYRPLNDENLIANQPTNPVLPAGATFRPGRIKKRRVWMSAIDIGVFNNSPQSLQTLFDPNSGALLTPEAIPPAYPARPTFFNEGLASNRARIHVYDTDNPKTEKFTVLMPNNTKSVYANQRYKILNQTGTEVSTTQKVGSWIDTDYIIAASNSVFLAAQTKLTASGGGAGLVSNPYNSVYAITSTPPLTLYMSNLAEQHYITGGATTPMVENACVPYFKCIVTLKMAFRGRKSSPFILPP